MKLSRTDSLRAPLSAVSLQMPESGTIWVSQGECRVSSDPDVVLATVLGSCVATCIRDPISGVGGMNHFMLPSSADGQWGQDDLSLRFGNFAIQSLIDQIVARGGHRDRLEAKVFGGANVLSGCGDVGWKNATFVLGFLKLLEIPIKAQHLFGQYPRKVNYIPSSGAAFLMELKEKTSIF